MLYATRQSVPFAVGVIAIAAPLLTIALVLATSATKHVSSMFVIGWAAGITTAMGLIVAFSLLCCWSRESVRCELRINLDMR
jgi:hypothetical protein